MSLARIAAAAYAALLSRCYPSTGRHISAHTRTHPQRPCRFWKPEKFRAVGVSVQRQQMRYNHRERLRQENTQTIVAARADIHRTPPLKLDPSEFRVKKGPSKEMEEQMAAEKKRMEIAEAKQRDDIAQIAQAEIAKVRVMRIQRKFISDT